jgi:flagellin
MRVNFNYEGTSTHTAYLVNQREMGKSLLRLSTGMRILEAADDAAGLFIADQLSVVATGLQEGNRNIATGISSLKIAENASGQIFERLRGIYSRAIRASNDINDPNARTSLQREVANLTDAIQKIGTDTEYNGIKLLDGTFAGKFIHYGSRMDQVVNVSVSDVRAQSLGAFTVQAQGATYTNNTINSSGNGTLGGLVSATGALGGAPNFRLDSGDSVTINGKTVYQYNSTTGPELVDAAKLAKSINNDADLRAIGIEAKAVNTSVASAYNNPVTITAAAGSATKSVTIHLNFYIGDGSDRLTINNFASASGITSSPAPVTTMSLDELVSRINSAAATESAPITAINDGGRLKLLTNNGETIAIEAQVVTTGTDNDDTLTLNINFGQLLEGGETATQVFDDNPTSGYTAAVKVGRVTIAANEAFNFTYNGVSDNGDPNLKQGFNFDIASGASTPFSNLYSIDLSTNAGAERALMIISKALQKVDTIRSQIGAVMNNLQSIFDAQKVSYDNTKQAESVIRNTDYAEEMSNFTTLQVKMQSTMAMLAQANTLPQMVLQLLR